MKTSSQFHFFEWIKIMSIKIILNFLTIFYKLTNTLYANSPIKNLNYQIDGKDYSSYLVKPKGYTKGIIYNKDISFCISLWFN